MQPHHTDCISDEMSLPFKTRGLRHLAENDAQHRCGQTLEPFYGIKALCGER